MDEKHEPKPAGTYDFIANSERACRAAGVELTPSVARELARREAQALREPSVQPGGQPPVVRGDGRRPS